jgi:CRISPR/Cas system-associated protein Csm6
MVRRCLALLYSRKDYDSDVHEVKRLSNTSEQRFAREGLRSLVDETMSIIHNAGGPENVVICGTGGWKAEIAYLNLIGLLRRIEVYYIYEKFQKVIELPRLPLVECELGPQTSALSQLTRRWPEAPIQEAEEYQRKQPRGEREDLEQLFADNEDGTASLTPAGEAIYQAFGAEWHTVTS